MSRKGTENWVLTAAFTSLVAEESGYTKLACKEIITAMGTVLRRLALQNISVRIQKVFVMEVKKIKPHMGYDNFHKRYYEKNSSYKVSLRFPKKFKRDYFKNGNFRESEELDKIVEEK